MDPSVPSRGESTDAWTGFVCASSNADRSGVFSVSVDRTTGELSILSRTPARNPYYAVTHPEGQFLYTVDRVSGGHVCAYRIDAETTSLQRLNDESSGGAGPCYVSVDSGGRYAFTANYDAGTVAVLPIEENGRLDSPSDVVTHTGSGSDPERQVSPHPHSIVPGPRDEFVYVPDLGTDRVVGYRLDVETGTLQHEPAATLSVPAGSGPRHLVFEESGLFGYLVDELVSTVTMLSVDPETGALTPLDRVRTLPDAGDDGANTCADVHVHPSGRWVYASNRGHDSIAVLRVDRDTGTLGRVDCTSTRGRKPRDFCLTPSGEFLFAENRDSGTIAAFAVDAGTGTLTPTASFDVPKPTCFVFTPS